MPKKKQNYLIRLFHRYDIDLKVIDTSNVEDVGSMTTGQFLARKSRAIEPDLDEINFFSQLAKIH